MLANSIDFTGFDEFLSQFEPDLKDELLESMLTELTTQKENLIASYSTHNTQQLRRHAHGIKGTALTFCLDDLAKQSEAVELCSSDGSDITAQAKILAMQIQTLVLTVKSRGEQE